MRPEGPAAAPVGRATPAGLRSRTFLGFAEQRPHLRAIEFLREPRLKAIQATADEADAAFAHMWLRSGWLAIRSHRQLWALPVPLTGTATLLGETWDTHPSDDGDGVWIQHDDGERWVTVDGRGSLSGDEFERHPGESLEAVFGQIVLVRDGQNQSLTLRRPGLPDLPAGEGWVLCQAGRLAFVRADLGATLFALDLTTGTSSEIPRQGFGGWGQFASASPDSTEIALGCSLDAAPRSWRAGTVVGETLPDEGNPQSTERRNVMTIIDARSLSIRVLDGVFENFATTPAWSSSSDGFVFAIPFEQDMWAWADRAGTGFHRLRMPRQAPIPLCDVTDVIGRGVA